MISSVAGMIPSEMISETVCPAASTDLKWPSIVTTRSGEPHQAHEDLRGDAQRPLGPDQKPHHIRARLIGGFAAQPDLLAVGKHHLGAEDVVACDPVLQAVRPAAFSPRLPPIEETFWLAGSGA